MKLVITISLEDGTEVLSSGPVLVASPTGFGMRAHSYALQALGPARDMLSMRAAEAEKAASAAPAVTSPVPPPQAPVPVEEEKQQALLLSERTANALLKHGIDTMQKILQCSAEDLAALDGIGEKSIREIEIALAQMGLALSGAKSSPQAQT